MDAEQITNYNKCSINITKAFYIISAQYHICILNILQLRVSYLRKTARQEKLQDVLIYSWHNSIRYNSQIGNVKISLSTMVEYEMKIL